MQIKRWGLTIDPLDRIHEAKTEAVSSSEASASSGLRVNLASRRKNAELAVTKTLWLTYAWVDNEDADVDHVIRELGQAGLDLHFDRRQIIPGQRLWPQIDKEISDPKRTDA